VVVADARESRCTTNITRGTVVQWEASICHKKMLHNMKHDERERESDDGIDGYVGDDDDDDDDGGIKELVCIGCWDCTLRDKVLVE
jgi:hypothetical protein